MRAVTIVDGALVVATRPDPEPRPGEVIVRVHGAGLNRADLMQRAGGYPAPPGVAPDIPGLEFAGVVDAAGSDAAGLEIGDRVFGLVGGGAQAELVRVPAAHCAHVPDGLELVEMGGVPEAFVTAHDALVTRAQHLRGEWVLIHAIGSGVGTAGLQLAKALGAQVIGTARTAEKLDRCRLLGLDAGVVPPSAGGNLDTAATVASLLELTGQGVDVVLDLVGGPYVEVDIDVAALKGRIVLIGALAGGNAQLSVLSVMGKRLTITGTMLRARDAQEKTDAIAAFAHDVVPLLAAGTVRPVVDAMLPMERVADAYDLLASDATFGKVILDCR
jgi:putative PIG3 family NAD(P)H quinone oxidoreductase